MRETDRLPAPRGPARRRSAVWAATLLLACASPPAASANQGTHSDAVGSDDGINRPEFYRYVERAFPNPSVGLAQTEAARSAFAALSGRAGPSAAWKQLSYKVGKVPALVTYTDRAFTAAGRVTALALTPGCADDDAGACQAVLGAAGGGIWIGDDPFGKPRWSVATNGLTSNAIGAIAVDPNKRGRVIYVGTGEPNSSADSEAGVGLFKSVDGGQSWEIVPASVPLATGLSVSAVIVDPRDSRHILFSTMTALHGLAASADSSIPPGVTPPGIYESRDGGKSFKPLYNALTNKFTGGVVQMALDPNDLDTIYASAFNVGLIRSSAALDGDRIFRLVYAHVAVLPGAPNDNFNRQAFALAKRGRKTRVYVGDSNDGDATSYLFRTDDASVPAAKLTDGTANPAWTMLSSPTPGTPGYSSWGFCEGQCWYDIYLASPPGQPDVVWFGGSMNYDEIFLSSPPSNGRAVMRSTDAGVSFTDMTRDARNPAGGMHPDQHVLAFNPRNPVQVLAGSDGGMVLTSGELTDDTAQCAARGLTGADLTDCKSWLAAIPTTLVPVNDGLETLQYQGVTFNPSAPEYEWQGGTQDNGTWQGVVGNHTQTETVGGDGGASGFDAVLTNRRFHTYYDPQMDVNFQSGAPSAWDWVADPLLGSKESSEFYIPAVADPLASGTIFAGLQHVWRTQDFGGAQAYLDQHCNEYTGDFAVTCGDFAPLGLDLTSASYGPDRTGGVVALISRNSNDLDTMWVATNGGRVFVSRNASDAAASAVTFSRIDSASTPSRVVSGIAVDPLDGGHAYVAYTGYSAYTPTTPGHVFDVRAEPGAAASFTDISANLGDMPITALVHDPATGDLYAGTDFGVVTRRAGAASWAPAGAGLPYVAVYQLQLTEEGLLYAATHGRGIWTLKTRR